MMETLTLNDGTVVNGHCMEDDRNLFVYLDGMSVLQGVMLFGDPDKSSHIVEMNHGVEHIYDGYTELFSADHEYGNCNLVMRKG